MPSFASKPPGCAAATGTAGAVTIRTSNSFPMCPATSLPGQSSMSEATSIATFIGQRVTMPFVAGCGSCPECQRGNPQICDHQFQPGFTGWGSFAEFVAVRYANGNLVPLPEDMTSVAAAAMGCRLGTVVSRRERARQVEAGRVDRRSWLRRRRTFGRHGRPRTRCPRDRGRHSR